MKKEHLQKKLNDNRNYDGINKNKIALMKMLKEKEKNK